MEPLLTGLTVIWLLIIPLVLVWSIAWKGIALWKAGRNNDLAWFIILFIINTLGILEIMYIFAFSRKDNVGKDHLTELN